MKKILLTLLLVLFSIGSWADNSQKASPEGYVAPRDFYWTRVFWQGTKDTFWRGQIRSVDKDGTAGEIQNPLVLGIELTSWAVKVANEGALELLGKYKSSNEKNVFRDYPEKVGRSVKELFTKTWTHLTHKAEKIGEIALQNHDSATSLEKKSTALYLLSYPLYTARTVVHSAIVAGVEFPVEFTGRTLYRLGDISANALSPAAPAVGAAAIYLVLDPYVIVLGGGTSVIGGATGVVLTGLVATVEGTIEGGRWILGDRSEMADSQQTSSPAEKAMLYVKLPARSDIEKTADQIFMNSQSKQELFDGLEQLIASVPQEEQWIVMGNIVGRLEKTTQGLEKSLDGKSSAEQEEILKEWDELSNLKIVYSLDLEKRMPRDLGTLAYTQ